MKLTLAAFAFILAAGCSHKQVREPAQTPSQASGMQTIDDGTVSGAPSSLGAVSSGRGH